MKNSSIEWCDHTFNGWIGCTHVSPGCANCYACERDKRFAKGIHWGKGAPRHRTSEANWKEPLKWDKYSFFDCPSCGHSYEVSLNCKDGWSCFCDGETPCVRRRPRVFCASLSDWLDDEVECEWLADLLHLIYCTPHLDWLLLTKRPQNFFSRIQDILEDSRGLVHLIGNDEVTEFGCWLNDWRNGEPPSNVWVGTSVEDQQRANERIPELLKIPAKVQFLSCEPLLGPVEIEDYLEDMLDGGYVLGSAPIHWVICGGESGPKARPMHPDWARALRDQCGANSTPFFFKRWGEWLPFGNGGTAYMDGFKTSMVLKNGDGPTGWPMYWVGKKSSGRILDGRIHDAFPEVQS